MLPDRGLSRAVLIGTSDFARSDRLPALPAVRQNLTELLDALTSADSGILDPEHCVLIDTPRWPADLMGRLQLGAQQAEDLLLVYYAGHGIRHETDDELYLSVRETDPDGLDWTAVPFRWVRQTIENSPARTRLLILDCCFSGLAIGSMSDGPIDVRISGTCVITSSPRNKISHSPPNERLTAFTGELISLLIQGSHVAGEALTVQVLFRGLVAAMANRKLPEPKMRAGDLSGDLLLRRGELKHPEPLDDDEVPPPPPPPPPPPQYVATPVSHLVLWLALALFLDMTIGGLVGLFIGKRSTDLGPTISMSFGAAICFLMVWLGVTRRRVTIVGDLRDTLRRTVVRWRPGLLATIAVSSLAVGIAATRSAQESGTTSTISDLAITVAIVLWLGQFAAICLYAIVRRSG